MDVSGLRASITAQGGSLSHLYDRRFGLSAETPGLLDAWSPIVGSAALVSPGGTARPVVNTDGSLTFDGVNDILRASGASFGITADLGVFLVMKGQAAVGGRAFDLSVAATSTVSAGAQLAGPLWSVFSIANASMLQNAANPQILHSRKATGTVVGSQVGAGTEVTAASAVGALTPTRLTLGANRSDVAASFASVVGLYAVGIVAGSYVSAIATAVNAWAVANHGAVA